MIEENTSNETACSFGKTHDNRSRIRFKKLPGELRPIFHNYLKVPAYLKKVSRILCRNHSSVNGYFPHNDGRARQTTYKNRLSNCSCRAPDLCDLIRRIDASNFENEA